MSANGQQHFRVLVTCPQMQRSMDRYMNEFALAGIQVDMPELVQQLSEDELIEIIGDYDGMIAGDDPVTARVLASAGKLRIISKWGVGIDNIDVAAAVQSGIKVTNTPGTFGGEVADVTVGYLIMLARQLHTTDRLVRAGTWPKIQGNSLAGKTLGVIGLGSIGYAVARRALAMDMYVHGHDVMDPACLRAADIGVQIREVEQIFARADYIALCCPLTEETRHIVNEKSIAAMKPAVSIINTARGPLIDEAALIEALRSGHVASAALDVFEVEPLPAESPLRNLDQVILGAHNSSNTLEGTLRVNRLAMKNLFEGLGCAVEAGGATLG